ncbi:MAG: glycosyltransferase [Sphingobium sp.]
MTRPIGYYVHHHGDGHRQRAIALADHLGERVTLIGTGLADRSGGHAVLDLPDDRLPDGTFDGQDGVGRPPSLHYAPIDHEGVRQRAALLTGWIARARPALLVVDVSVEIAMLARLASVPTIYVRLNGRRVDRPHLDAFEGATALLAPFHAELDDEETPDGIRRKTFYAPGIGPRAKIGVVEDDLILGVVGRGGSQCTGEDWPDAARATPHLRWQIIGPSTVPADCPANLSFLGWVTDAADLVARAGVVVGAAGDGLVGAVLAARRPFLCIPEDRPFDEQRVKARRLHAAGAAITSANWPAPDDWPDLIERAHALATDNCARLDDPDGARRTARWLAEIADGTVQGRDSAGLGL